MHEAKVSHIFLGLIAVLFFGFSLGLCYASLAKLSVEGWALILGLNSLIGVAVLRYLPTSLRPQPLMSRLRSLWVPGLFLLAILLASFTSGMFGSLPYAASNSFGIKTWVMIIGAPWAEELVFRGGIGRALEVWLGTWWGRYGSSLVFGLAHGGGALSSYYFPIVPIGPFLLGWCCSLSYSLTGRLSAPVALHAVCNASVIIFNFFDPRWLEWLSFLYLKI